MVSLAISLGIATSVLIIRSTDEIAAAYPEVPYADIQSTINGLSSDIFEELRGEARIAIARIVARNIGRVVYLNVAGAGLGFVYMLLMKFERLDLAVKVSDQGHENETGSPASQ